MTRCAGPTLCLSCGSSGAGVNRTCHGDVLQPRHGGRPRRRGVCVHAAWGRGAASGGRDGARLAQGAVVVGTTWGAEVRWLLLLCCEQQGREVHAIAVLIGHAFLGVATAGESLLAGRQDQQHQLAL